MEFYKYASWQIYKMAISRRNLIFLTVVSWLSVLYFSLHKDGIDALLSFVAVSLTVCAFRRMRCIGDTLAYVLNVASRVFILAGISLATFSDFWNTSFYATCLGFLIQKMIYDMELRATNVDPDLRVQAFPEIIERDSSDDFKQMKPRESLKLRKLTQNRQMQEYEMKELYVHKQKSAILEALNEMQLQSSSEQNEEIIPKEIRSLCKKSNEPRPDASETVNCLDEILSIEKFVSHFPELFNEVISRDESIRKSRDNLDESSESNLKYSDTLQESEMICSLEFDLLNLKESSLNQISEIKAEFDLAVSDIERELQEQEVADMDSSKQSASLNGESLNISLAEDIKQLDVTSNIAGALDEPENKIYKEFFIGSVSINSDRPLDFTQNNDLSFSSYKNLQRQDQNDIKRLLESMSNYVESESQPENKVKRELFVNIHSEAYTQNSQKNDLKSSCAYENSCRQNKDPIKHKSDLEDLHIVKSEDSDLLNKTACSNINLRNQGRSGEVNGTNSDIDRKIGLTIESHLDGNSSKTNEELDSKTKYPSLKCTCVETYIQPENETCAYKLNCISVDNENEDIENQSSKKDELVDVETKNLSLESGKQGSREAGATLSSCSNVQGVVNRIDSRFIYAIGINDISTTNLF